MKRILRLLILMQFGVSVALGQTLYFPPKLGAWETVDPAGLQWNTAYFDTLTAYLTEANTKSFLILKDGRIAWEQYFGTFTQDSLWFWASAGKTLTATMVGIAQDEGYLQIDQKTSDFLGTGFTSLPSEKEALITIRHQLTMTTGLEDDVPDTDCTLPECLKYKADAGTRWAYYNAAYLLLHPVLEAATGKNINTLIYQWINQKIGMTGFWYDHVYYSKARDAARFGLMMLAGGQWDGEAVVADTAYFNRMVNTSQSLNKSYGYLWWLNGKESFMIPQSQLVLPGSMIATAPDDLIAGLGKYDQRVYVVPSENLVVVRFGQDAGAFIVGPTSFDTRVWGILQKLIHGPGGIEQAHHAAILQAVPNPTHGMFSISGISCPHEPLSVEVRTLDGSLIKTQMLAAQDLDIDLGGLAAGGYMLRLVGQQKVYTVKCLLAP